MPSTTAPLPERSIEILGTFAAVCRLPFVSPLEGVRVYELEEMEREEAERSKGEERPEVYKEDG